MVEENPVFSDGVIHLESDLPRKTNGVNVEDIEDVPNQCALRTAAWHSFWFRLTIPKSKDHLSVLEVA